MAEQRTVLFSGDVQGVGFRATTARLASGLAVTGTVRNLPDGRVELVAEGTAAEIDRLVHSVQQHFGEQVTDTTSTTAPPTGRFEKLIIAY